MTAVSRQTREQAPVSREARPWFAAPGAVRTAQVLSWLLVVVMAGTAAAGLWVSQLYQDPVVVVAAERGANLVALVLVAPLLAWSTWAAARGSSLALLMWPSLLAYSTYMSAFSAFGTAFNDAFLAHLVQFALSVYGLVFVLVAVDARRLATHFGPRTPARLVGALLLLVAVSMAGAWGWSAIRWSLTGEQPLEAFPMPLERVHLGYVMDAAVLAPAAVIAGVLLWRRLPWGYVLGTVVMTAVAVVQIAYLSIQAFVFAAEVPGVAAVDVVYLPFVAVMVLAAIWMLRSVQHRVVADADDRPTGTG